MIEAKKTNSGKAVELKIPCENTDDYGNSHTFFKKEITTEESLLRKKEELMRQLVVIEQKLSAIVNAT